MNWMVLAVVLIGWGLVGLGLAYLFGRFIRAVDTPEDVNGVVPYVVSYPRRGKRARFATRARLPAQPKRRASGG